jgi:hypothetical protein
MKKTIGYLATALVVLGLSGCSPQEPEVSASTTLEVFDEFVALHPLHPLLNSSSSSESYSLLQDLIGVVCSSLEAGIPNNLLVQELKSPGGFTAVQMGDLISLSIKYQCPTLG